MSRSHRRARSVRGKRGVDFTIHSEDMVSAETNESGSGGNGGGTVTPPATPSDPVPIIFN